MYNAVISAEIALYSTFDIMISAEIALMTDQWSSWSSIGLVGLWFSCSWQQLAEVAEVASALCYANQPDLWA